MSDVAAQFARVLDGYGALGASDIQLTSNRGAYLVKDKLTKRIENISPGQSKVLVEGLRDAIPPAARKLYEDTGQAGASFDQGGTYRGRVAIREESGGLSSTVRIISREIPTVEKLKLSKLVVSLTDRPSGLVLYVGQTGSGKSTSIAAINRRIIENKFSSIYTLEDPIEYLYPVGKSLVVQREIGVHVRSFAEGIENAKRSHPKIILVGEILNADTARSALLAAASGHLVVSTMHAGTAGEAVDSFTSMFLPEEQGLIRTQLAQSLVGIIAQKLIPKIGGGLSMAQEIAINTPSFASLLRGGGSDRGNDTKFIQQLLLGTGTQDGMVAMEESLARLVKSQIISFESAAVEARDRKAFHEKCAQVGVVIPPQAA